MEKKAIISDECVACGLCASICPVYAISQPDGSACYKVNTSLCVHCGNCLGGVCPVDAISSAEVPNE